ncbi:MAG: hypothetical protein MJZ30_05905 [Paludibacteraceae bacterium]|nr:hypothetical protein [Paludibacteraceae bacterium]
MVNSEYIDQLSMFNPTIARLRAEQQRVNEMKRQAAQENYRRLVSVTPGRKPLWAKIEEETAMAYESLFRKCEHSTRSVTTIQVADIIAQYRKEHPDPAPAPVLVLPHSIFREFYHKVVVYGNS